MTMEECPVCATASPRERLEKSFSLHHCPKCDLVFSNPMKSPGEEWYKKHLKYENRVLGFYEFLSWAHRQFLSVLPDGRHLLDVGCGSGSFLSEAEKKGYTVSGIDFDKRAISTARNVYGLEDVHVINLKDFTPRRRYDIITMFDLLEHVDNPRALVRNARRMLSNNGFLFVSVPNRNRKPDTVSVLVDNPPHHLTKWSRESLVFLLERNGYSVVFAREKPFTLYESSRLINNLFFERRFFHRIKILVSNLIFREKKAGKKGMPYTHRNIVIAKEKFIEFLSLPIFIFYKLKGDSSGVEIVALARKR